MTLQIWIDEQIADRSAFERLGQVHAFSGRTLDSEALKSADALIVRSVTRVDAHLLTGTGIRFVGTVTTGLDHIDTDYLEAKGIQFASAAGFNARPVAEYVLAAILLVAADRETPPAALTLGVVGVGRIGRLACDWGSRLGMNVVRNDPPREYAGEPGAWVQIDSLLAQSDIVTLHVPFSTGGAHATAGMADASWISRMKYGATLINTSRGGIVDEAALKAAVTRRSITNPIIDTWANEPAIDRELLSLCRIATPHTAGHSREALHRGSAMIRESLAEWAGIHDPGAALASNADAAGAASGRVNGEFDRKRMKSAAVACDLQAMDVRFRSAMANDGEGFDSVRRAVGGRREYSHQFCDVRE